MCVKGIFFLCGLAALAVLQVSGIYVYTPGDVMAINGMDIRLKCTFQTASKIYPDGVSISWRFRTLQPGREEEEVFYYQQKAYSPQEGMFRNRTLWAGDIMGKDASIIIREVNFAFNGTYTCRVKNPPDVHGWVGEIRLRVVNPVPAGPEPPPDYDN